MRFSFFGAAPDTGNLGVSALCYATIINIIRQQPDAEITVFDYSRGRSKLTSVPNCEKAAVYRQGAVYARNLFRKDNIKTWRLLGMLGGLGNPGVDVIQQSDVVIDISGGDSFTDLYGQRRFNSISLMKLLALQFGKPLVLLPQTYGPFKSEGNKQIASQIVKRATCAWARDSRSFDVLVELLGETFDPNRHRCGVDMAFGLPSIKPTLLPSSWQHFLGNNDSGIIGINVSGLIYNDPQNAQEKFGFKAHYNTVIFDLIKRFLLETNCKIVLVPHVIAPEGALESDLAACRDVLSRLGNCGDDRIIIINEYDNPCTAKWIISQFDWFCGTRMHATIAALSSAVPVAAISYSPKTLGVFETCGQGDHVADPQNMGNEAVLECLWASWENRLGTYVEYENKLPEIRQIVNEQIRTILNVSKD